MKPLISIILVNWNGKKWLKECLDSLMVQTYKNFEIILVDNNSSDGSVEFVHSDYPEVIVVQNRENLGFSGGNNIGYQKSRGEYVLLLNNDTRVERNFLEEFVKAFYEIPNLGSVQSKLILMYEPAKLDVCGSYWTDIGFLYHYGYAKDTLDPKYNRKMPFFSNKGASMMLKREVIEKVGLFDHDFWCYYEETDLCHRLWLAGYECWYYPTAVCYHAMGGTAVRFSNSFLQFHNFKNKLASFLKNFEWVTLAKFLPIYLVLNVLLSFVWLFQGKYKHFFSLYKAIFWNLIHLLDTMNKRKEVQKLRVRSDKSIFKKVKRNPTIRYYFGLLIGIEKYVDKF